MKKVGRPRKFTSTIHINIRADEVLKKTLESYARHRKKNVSEVVRDAVYYYLRSFASHYNDDYGILRKRKL